jgi:kinesin family protein 5
MQASAILSLRRGVRVSLSCQYVEIFEETCSCLLSGAKCLVRRDSGEVSGATEAPLSTLADCFEVLRTGQLRKRFASTAMNDHSSRSHTVFILHVLSARTEEEGGATPGEQQDLLCVKSRAVLVDLAGSERVKKSLVVGARLKEAIGINNSLLVLGRVIAALASSAPHVPYLESRLTTLLKSSFGGNSRTHVITCCRQADAFGDETLWSLRFASRCSLISNFSRSIATSAQAAAESLDASLASVKAQLEGMRLRGLDKIESFSKLEASYRGLLLKRSDLQALRS